MAEILEKESSIMKRIVVLTIVILMCILLCACDSEAVAAAKKAYEDSNYEGVVVALADEEITDSKVAEMLTISKANIAFADNQYCEVVSLLQNIENYNENELYNKALDAAVKNAVETYDVSSLVDVYGLDASIEERVYQTITEACMSFDFDAFCYMEDLIEELPEGTLKENLSKYAAGNQKTKVKSFMNGEWKWNYGEDENEEARVTLYMNEDDEKCIGFLSQCSKLMESFYYKENDLYWQEFIFAGDFPVSVVNTTRDTYGNIIGEKVSVKLDIDNSKMIIHLSDATYPDRVWERIS